MLEQPRPEENVQAPGAALPWTPGAPAHAGTTAPVKKKEPTRKFNGRKPTAKRSARPGPKRTAPKRAVAKRETRRPAR